MQMGEKTSLALLLLLLALLASGCSMAPHPARHLEREEPHLFPSSIPKPRGVFLVIHGLNLRPSALNPISTALAQMGFHSYRMTLAGHNEVRDQPFDEGVWLEDVRKAYTDLRARFKTLPIFITGYSLGGLLATRILDSLPPADLPRGMILIAPALSLRSFPELASIFRLPPPWSLEIPNLAPRPYRRYPSTPLFWYSNTLTIYRDVQNLHHPNLLAQIPTLVFINPRDELISPRGVRDWIDENGMASTWRVQLIQPSVSSPLLAEHLMLDLDSLGEQEWTRMHTAIRDFLGETLQK